IDSPSGSYTPANNSDADGKGRANFGFVAKTVSNSPTPIGNTEFQLRLRKNTPPQGNDDDDETDAWRRRDCRGNDDGWDDDRFSNTNLDFHSTSYSSLTVTGTTQAIFKGVGTVNGVSGYSFLVSVTDGRSNGADKFRIKIWNTSTGTVLYDNQY